MSKGFRRNAPRTLRFFVRTCVSSRQPLVPFRGMRPGSSCGSSTPRFRSFSRTHRSIRSPFFGSTSDGTIHGPTSPPLHPSSLPSRGCRTPEARPRHHHPRRPCHVHSRFVKKNPPRLPFLSRFSLFFYGRGWWGGTRRGSSAPPGSGTKDRSKTGGPRGLSQAFPLPDGPRGCIWSDVQFAPRGLPEEVGGATAVLGGVASPTLQLDV